MAKKTVGVILLFCVCVLGIFGFNSLASVTEKTAVECQEPRMQDENLAMPDRLGTVNACLFQLNFRTSAVRGTAVTVKTGIRQRSSRLLCFFVIFCMAFKRMLCASDMAILSFCLIFISYFRLQLLIVYRSDGKKRCPFVFA